MIEAWRPWRAYAAMHLWLATEDSEPLSQSDRNGIGTPIRTGVRRFASRVVEQQVSAILPG